MNTHILYAYFGGNAAKKLAALVGGTAHDSRRSALKCSDDDLVIRWGSPHSLSESSRPHVINHKNKILESSSKGHARTLMRLYGVSIPTPWDGKRSSLPVIARPEIHSQGSSYFMCKTMAQANDAKANGCTYFSKVFKKKNEYRVHVARGKVLFIQEKPLRGGRIDEDAAWRVLTWDEYKKPVCVQAIKAVECFGLDFAGVDVMWDGRRAVVCEINCAPCVDSDLQRTKYANLFKWFIKTAGEKQSWDWSSFEAGEDFAWRLSELKKAIPDERRQ